jgi:hypothetical protein
MTASGGCLGRTRIPPKPAFDSMAAAKQALTAYDANGDGKLDAEELKKCPSLQDGLKRIDKDGDGQLTGDEIAARLQHWQAFKGVLTSAHTVVTLDGKPLAQATVTLEPEKFMGDSFPACTGTTDALGHVSFSGSVPGFPGVYFGWYRVRVAKLAGGKESIPGKYNQDSELGLEISDDVAPASGFLELDLKSG